MSHGGTESGVNEIKGLSAGFRDLLRLGAPEARPTARYPSREPSVACRCNPVDHPAGAEGGGGAVGAGRGAANPRSAGQGCGGAVTNRRVASAIRLLSRDGLKSKRMNHKPLRLPNQR